jgi:hypothetical protein
MKSNLLSSFLPGVKVPPVLLGLNLWMLPILCAGKAEGASKWWISSRVISPVICSEATHLSRHMMQ